MGHTATIRYLAGLLLIVFIGVFAGASYSPSDAKMIIGIGFMLAAGILVAMYVKRKEVELNSEAL